VRDGGRVQVTVGLGTTGVDSDGKSSKGKAKESSSDKVCSMEAHKYGVERTRVAYFSALFIKDIVDVIDGSIDASESLPLAI
jgi:hypothetical protein